MKNNLLTQLLVIAISISITACTSASATPADRLESSPTPPNPQSAEATEIATSDPMNQAYSSGSLKLTLVSPLDGSETNLPQTELAGSVSENAVLSINDEIYMLDAGNFSQQIPLEAGPNVFQVVVSDDSGNEIDLVLTITYNAD
jgi:hypothetical protein